MKNMYLILLVLVSFGCTAVTENAESVLVTPEVTPEPEPEGVIPTVDYPKYLSTSGSYADHYTPKSERNEYGRIQGYPQGDGCPGLGQGEVGLNKYVQFQLETISIALGAYIVAALTLVEFDSEGRGVYRVKGMDWDSDWGTRHGIFRVVLEWISASTDSGSYKVINVRKISISAWQG